MRGADHRKDDPTQRLPPTALAERIAQLLREACATPAARIAHLRTQLQSDAFAWDHAGLGEAISAAHAAGREMHVRDLRQGWLDKLLGEHRAMYARFVAAYDRIVVCAARLKMQASELAAGAQAHDERARGMLADFDAQLRCVEGEIERGVGWLQAMCAQLGEPGATAHDDPQLAACAESAHVFTEQFRRLHAIVSIGSDIAVRGKDVLARRAALLGQVRGDVDVFEKQWMRAVADVVVDAKAGRDPVHAAARILDVHDELMKRLSLSGDACSALQHEEHLFTQQLLLLQQELEALGSPA